MKKFISLVLALSCLLLSTLAFADPAPEAASPYPSWLPLIVTQAEQLPTIGAAVQTGIAWAGTIAGVATAASVFLMTIFGSLQGVLHSTGLSNLATKVQAFEAKVMPFVQYWSMFNVQRPQATSAAAAPPKPTASS